MSLHYSEYIDKYKGWVKRLSNLNKNNVGEISNDICDSIYSNLFSRRKYIENLEFSLGVVPDFSNVDDVLIIDTNVSPNLYASVNNYNQINDNYSLYALTPALLWELMIGNINTIRHINDSVSNLSLILPDFTGCGVCLSRIENMNKRFDALKQKADVEIEHHFHELNPKQVSISYASKNGKRYNTIFWQFVEDLEETIMQADDFIRNRTKDNVVKVISVVNGEDVVHSYLTKDKCSAINVASSLIAKLHDGYSI